MSDKAKRFAAVAALATAIAVPAEGLRLRYLASLAVADKVDKRLGHSGNYGQRVRGYALMQKLADVYHLLGRKFVRWLALTIEVYKAGLPSVLRVSRQTDPFKVLGPVVCLDAVDVIDAQPRSVTIDKSHCNQTMNKKPRSLSIDAKPDLAVPGVVWLRRVFLWLSGAAYGLHLPVPNSGVGVWPRRDANAPKVADLKRDSALFDCFPLFHVAPSNGFDVYIIGGLQ